MHLRVLSTQKYLWFLFQREVKVLHDLQNLPTSQRSLGLPSAWIIKFSLILSSLFLSSNSSQVRVFNVGFSLFLVLEPFPIFTQWLLFFRPHLQFFYLLFPMKRSEIIQRIPSFAQDPGLRLCIHPASLSAPLPNIGHKSMEGEAGDIKVVLK